MKTYKIYNPVLNMYSSGGQYHYKLWSKTGKSWSSLKNLNAHFKLLEESPWILEKYKTDNCVIITYNEVSRELVEDFVK